MSGTLSVPESVALRSDRRQFLLGGALLAALAASQALRPKSGAVRIDQATLERAIPLSVGPYRRIASSGLIVAAPDEVSQRIYDKVLTRIYGAAGLPEMMLLIAYGSAQDAALAVHRPENCYAAAGYRVSAPRRVALSGMKHSVGEATLLAAQLDGRTEQIYFWTRIGQRFPASFRHERRDVLRANLAGRLPDGVLVRLSMVSADADRALPMLSAFNALLLASLGAAGRRLVLGDVA